MSRAFASPFFVPFFVLSSSSLTPRSRSRARGPDQERRREKCACESSALYLDSHAPARSRNLPDSPLQAFGIQVLHFCLGDLLELGPRDRAHRLPARGSRSLGKAHGFSDKDRRGGGLQDEVKAPVDVDRHLDGHRRSLEFPCSLVELLDELSNV